MMDTAPDEIMRHLVRLRVTSGRSLLWHVRPSRARLSGKGIQGIQGDKRGMRYKFDNFEANNGYADYSEFDKRGARYKLVNFGANNGRRTSRPLSLSHTLSLFLSLSLSLSLPLCLSASRALALSLSLSRTFRRRRQGAPRASALPPASRGAGLWYTKMIGAYRGAITAIN